MAQRSTIASDAMKKGWRAELWKQKWVVGLWLALNVADTVLTYISISLGAKEVWIVYRLSGSMTVTTIAKYAGVVLVVVVLTRYGRLRWLPWFFITAALPLAWGIFDLARWLL